MQLTNRKKYELILVSFAIPKPKIKKVLDEMFSEINLPKLKVGDRCFVTNYRSRHRPEEKGEVVHIRASFDRKNKPFFIYTVELDRESEAGNTLFLHLADENIWGINEFKNR